MTKHTTTNDDDDSMKLKLKLYVSGMSSRSMEAIENIKNLCEDYISNAYQLEIIDLYKNPEIAAEQQIVFSPSLVRYYPLPKKILVGTLSNIDKVSQLLELSNLK